MQVHVDRGGERYGPYSLEEVNAYLANGTLLPTDQAWQDGMADWVPIDQIPGVTMAGGPPHPPAAGATCPQCQAPVDVGQVICMGCGTRLQGEPAKAKGSKKKLLIGIGAGVGVLAIVAGIWFFLTRDGETIEPKEEVKKTNSPKIESTPTFASDPSDKNNVIIKAAIRKVIKKPTGELTQSDLEKVTGFDLLLREKGITDVSALAGLTQLRELEFYGNQITDVSPLAELTQLRELNLFGNQITNISALAGLTQLTELGLGDNKITDIRPLAKLTNLTELYLHDNQIADVSPLMGLTQLKKLLLQGNQITKADVGKLQKALLNCKIFHNF